MHAALVCPGPSCLHATACLHRYDVLIGANRAPSILARRGVAFDWWAANDFKVCDKWWAGTPRLLTTGETLKRLLADRHPLTALPIVNTESLYRVCSPHSDAPSWTLYTATAALVLAMSLGAKRVDAFGCDWSCEPDADGLMLKGCKRDAQRWATERSIWSELVKWLDGRGIEVKRL